MAAEDGKKQLLHLVFGGELKNLSGTEFRDLDALDIVGIYPDYQSAQRHGRPRPKPAWTMPICVISSFTCTGCSTPTTRLPVNIDGP